MLRDLVGRHILVFFEDLDGKIRDCTGCCINYMPPDLITLGKRHDKQLFDVLGKYILNVEVIE